MARLDVFPRPGPPGQGFLLDVQSNLLSHLKTRAVVLLLPEGRAPPPVRDFNPILPIDGQPHVLLPQTIATILVGELRGCVGSLDAEHDVITRALDILFVGH